MNSRFDKYMKLLNQEGVSPEDVEAALGELHKSFASLSQEEQKYANIFLHDIQRGDAVIEPGKSLRDYITEYQCRAKDDQIHRISEAIGCDEAMLRKIMSYRITESNINEYGRFDALINSVDINKATEFFSSLEGGFIPPFLVNMKVDELLRSFILSGGFDI